MYEVWIKNKDRESVVIARDQTRSQATELVRKLADVGLTVAMREQQ